MTPTRAASVAALLGGLVWVVAAVVDWGEDVNPFVYLVGLVWLLVALALAGYTLVDHAPVWLRGVVSIATPSLGYVVWAAVADAFPNDSVPVLCGGLVMIAAGGLGLGRKPARTVEAPVRGRRAAR